MVRRYGFFLKPPYFFSVIFQSSHIFSSSQPFGKPIESSEMTFLYSSSSSFNKKKSVRYDIKGRKYIGTLSKYYFQDIGLRNALLNFRQVEETHIMENVIYNELRSRGYSVDVGMVEARAATERKQLEVDFVANKGDKRYYIQSAYALPSDEKREHELASLKRINDSFKKILILREDIAPYHDDNGVLIIGLMDFLLKANMDEIR